MKTLQHAADESPTQMFYQVCKMHSSNVLRAATTHTAALCSEKLEDLYEKKSGKRYNKF